MVADVDTRELRVPWWARLGVLLAAVLQLGLGSTLLLWPQAQWFEALRGERLALQAIGLLTIAVGAGLVAAVLRPVRHSSFILACAVLKVAGLCALAILVMPGADWGATSPLLAVEVLVLVLAVMALLAIAGTPEITDLPADVRPVGTTTLFGLQQTLQALAAPATVQLAMFPDLVANGDRVMAEFRLWRERALQKQDLLSAQQAEALSVLDHALQGMLQEGAVGLWSADAVRSSPEWGHLRATARRALVAFAWSVDMPMGVLQRRRDTPSRVDMRPPT